MVSGDFVIVQYKRVKQDLSWTNCERGKPKSGFKTPFLLRKRGEANDGFAYLAMFNEGHFYILHKNGYWVKLDDVIVDQRAVDSLNKNIKNNLISDWTANYSGFIWSRTAVQDIVLDEIK